MAVSKWTDREQAKAELKPGPDVFAAALHRPRQECPRSFRFYHRIPMRPITSHAGRPMFALTALGAIASSIVAFAVEQET